MPRIQRGFLPLISLGLGLMLAAACTKPEEAQQPGQPGLSVQPAKEALHVDSRTAAFTDLVPGVTRSVIWGDPDTGPHGGFTKFAPGTQNALHAHTSEARIVVIDGAYLYTPENGPEQRIAAGHFLLVPAGARHASGGDATRGALFFDEFMGKFDLNFVK